jgi:hypothetical protein
MCLHWIESIDKKAYSHIHTQTYLFLRTAIFQYKGHVKRNTNKLRKFDRINIRSTDYNVTHFLFFIYKCLLYYIISCPYFGCTIPYVYMVWCTWYFAAPNINCNIRILLLDAYIICLHFQLCLHFNLSNSMTKKQKCAPKLTNRQHQSKLRSDYIIFHKVILKI